MDKQIDFSAVPLVAAGRARGGRATQQDANWGACRAVATSAVPCTKR